MKKTCNKLVGLFVAIIVVVLVIFVGARGRMVDAKNNQDRALIEQLQNEKAEEEKRAEQLEAYSKYVHTKQFIEEIARSRLGLVYPNEIIFKGE